MVLSGRIRCWAGKLLSRGRAILTPSVESTVEGANFYLRGRASIRIQAARRQIAREIGDLKGNKPGERL